MSSQQGANPEWEVIVPHSCTFPRPVSSHELKCDTVHKFRGTHIKAETFSSVFFFDKLFPLSALSLSGGGDGSCLVGSVEVNLGYYSQIIMHTCATLFKH